MSCRQGWTYNGQHFAKTSTERGGTRYFIDGTPTRREAWFAALNAARSIEAQREQAGEG
jgi:hypothetical protein